MKFVVAYDQDRDIWNHLNSNWKFTYRKWGRDDIQERLLKPYPQSFRDNLAKAKIEDQARIVIKEFLDSLPAAFHRSTPIIARELEANLNKNKEKIVNPLEKLFGKKFPFDKIAIYLHTCNINPYNYKERWFMSGRNESTEGHFKTAKHELNHFMFYYYYPSLRKKIGDEKFELLKEALAVFTNPEGNDKPAVKSMEAFLRTLPNMPMDKIISQVLEKYEWDPPFSYSEPVA